MVWKPEETYEGCDPGERIFHQCNRLRRHWMKPSIQMQRKFVILSTTICNGTTDDDIGGDWYRDADNDESAMKITLYSCGKPDGYVNTFGDCNDLDGEIYPDALEFCDYIDNDCDGLFDEEDAINKPTVS